MQAEVERSASSAKWDPSELADILALVSRPPSGLFSMCADACPTHCQTGESRDSD